MTLQLLAQVSHDDQLDAPKYKCAVSLDFICAISRYVCVCVCACSLILLMHMNETDWIIQVNWPFTVFLFFFSLKICFVWFIFQDGELWYCQVFVRLPVSLQCINREMIRSDSQTKAHLFLQETHLRTSIWKHKKLQEEINPIISLPPCGWWMSSSFKCLYLYKINLCNLKLYFGLVLWLHFQCVHNSYTRDLFSFLAYCKHLV